MIRLLHSVLCQGSRYIYLYLVLLLNFNMYLFVFTAKATYAAISKTYAYLTPDLWKETVFTKSPYQEFTDHLAKMQRAVAAGVVPALGAPAGGAPPQAAF